jgi:hypothetical protein
MAKEGNICSTVSTKKDFYDVCAGQSVIFTPEFGNKIDSKPTTFDRERANNSLYGCYCNWSPTDQARLRVAGTLLHAV